MKREWKILEDCNAEDGTPTTWYLKVSEGKFYWIEKSENNTFDIIDSDAQTVLMTCKSLSSAKRWVAMNL